MAKDETLQLGGLSCEVRSDEGAIRLHFAGEITENVDFSPVLALKGERFVLELADVERINSCGVREWVNFVRLLGERSANFAVEGCSVPMMQQWTMIRNFMGQGEVRSVYAPYYCEGCGNEAALLFRPQDLSREQLHQPQQCPHCGGEAMFDDLPDAYCTT